MAHTALMESASDSVGSGPLLLSTKFHPPVWRAELVSRPRLVETLERGAGRTLTLISAPAGFGKSALLAEWLGGFAPDRAVSWVSLDQHDNDPALFWTYVISALHAHPGSPGDRALASLRSLQLPPISSVLTSLINDLAGLPGRYVLVLDDVHMIENRSIHDGIGFLLDHVPPQLRVVMTTRADPPLNLARLRARGELSELRAAELRFTPDEARAFLNDVMQLQLSDDDIRTLDARSEGWIAGLQLAVLSIRDQDDASAFIQAFAGDHRYIVDYLLEEVLHRQSDAMRSFLLETSILERLSGPLCDAVTGRADGSRVLEALERGNFFLIPLDSTRTWYRFHHLFADVLRARLLAEYPAQATSLHLRASAWFEQEGSTAEAIGHALAAGAFERAADLVERAAREMQRTRQEATMLSWLSVLPEDEIRRRPVLSMAYAGFLLSSGMLEGVDTWLGNAERWLDAIQREDDSIRDDMRVADARELDRLPGSIAVYRAGAALATGDVAGTVAHARIARELVAEDDALYRGAATALLGLAAWTEGDLEAAYTSFEDGMASLERGGFIIDAIGGSLALADLRMAQGRLADARDVFHRGLRLAADHGLRAPRGVANMHVGLSEVYRSWNDLDAATRELDEAEQLGEVAGFPQFPYRWRVAAARLRASRGDLENADRLLADAERRFEGDMFPTVQPVPAMRARVWIRQGRLDEAFAWAKSRGITADEPMRYLRANEHLTLVRVLLARAEREMREPAHREAMDLLERLGLAAEEGAWTDVSIEASLLQALGFQQMGASERASMAVEKALRLAEPGGYVRTFVDEGEPAHRLLRTVASGAQGGGALRVLRSWGEMEPMEVRAMMPVGLTEPLTPREIEILRLIGAGFRNQEIADRLFISLPTVKRHVANAYGKLGVTHRTEAVARASALGLL